MNVVRLTILTAAVLWVAGCTSKKPWVQAGAQPVSMADRADSEQPDGDTDGSSNRWSGHISAYASACPPIPNARLQLPAVSPDAKWIAYLKPSDTGVFPGSDGLITGKGLQGVSLWVRAVAEDEAPTAIASSGACWPSWSDDGRVLAFVTFDQDRRSTLGLYHLDTGVIQRKGVGLRCVLMPTIAPDGGRVAVSAYGELPNRALIFIIDPLTNQALPGPPAGDGAQLLPRWINDNTLIYLETTEDAVELKRWTLGDESAATLARLPGPASIFDAQHMLAGIDNPIRPDLRVFAYYNLLEDRIEMLDLASQKTRVLPKGFQAGSWWGNDWLIASSQNRVELVSSQRTSGDTDRPRMIRVITGRWLPIWADHDRQAVVLIGEAEDPDAFSLMRLWLVAEEDG